LIHVRSAKILFGLSASLTSDNPLRTIPISAHIALDSALAHVWTAALTTDSVTGAALVAVDAISIYSFCLFVVVSLVLTRVKI
jgi:hypothetical protein